MNCLSVFDHFVGLVLKQLSNLPVACKHLKKVTITIPTKTHSTKIIPTKLLCQQKLLQQILKKKNVTCKIKNYSEILENFTELSVNCHITIENH